MTINDYANDIVGLLWTIYIVYWIVSARKVKRDIRREGGWWARLATTIIIGVILGFIAPVFLKPFFSQNTVVSIIALILTVVGIGLAIWARYHLGANWSSRPSIKEGHELITSGPYRFIRHPIYSGLLLAFIGTALINGLIWSFIFIAIALNLIPKVLTEERLMTQQFPEQYPEYKKKTKALIPFVW